MYYITPDYLLAVTSCARHPVDSIAVVEVWVYQPGDPPTPWYGTNIIIVNGISERVCLADEGSSPTYVGSVEAVAGFDDFVALVPDPRSTPMDTAEVALLSLGRIPPVYSA